MNNSGLGTRLREAREARGWSTFELASKIGRTRTTVYRYEHGAQYPRLEALVSLSTALGVSLDHLVFGPGGQPCAGA